MTGQLPHIVYQAATCPEFRAELLANLDAAVAEYRLEQDDLLALKEALDLLVERHGSDVQPAQASGWDGGPSFTGAL